MARSLRLPAARTLLLAAALFIAAGATRADTIHLRDGGTLAGAIVEPLAILPTTTEIRIQTKYGESRVPRADIDRIDWDPLPAEESGLDALNEIASVREYADAEYQAGLSSIQGVRADELVGGIHRLHALRHLERARDAYQKLGVLDPSRADFIERRLNEINSQIFWCSRFGDVSDLGLDAGGKVPTAEDEAAARREEQAAEALALAERYHDEQPNDFTGVMERYLDVVERFPGTKAAADARTAIAQVQDAMLAAARDPKPAGGEPTETGGATPAPTAPTPPAAPPTPEAIRAEMDAGLTQDVTAEGYRVRAASSYEDGLCASIAKQLGACRDVIAGLTGLAPPKDAPPLEILILANETDVVRYTSGINPDDPRVQRGLALAAGTSKSALFGPTHAIVTYRSANMEADLRRLSVEQLAKSCLSGSCPAFLGFGLGRYLELADVDPKTFKVRGSGGDTALLGSLKRALAPAGGGWRRQLSMSTGLLPLEELLTTNPERLAYDDADLAGQLRRMMASADGRDELYKAQSWAFVHWLLHGKGPKAGLEKFLDQLAKPKSASEAYRASFAPANGEGKLDQAFEKFCKDFTDR